MQVALTHSFCFPLAEVAVAVAARVPAFGPCLLAKLHQVGSQDQNLLPCPSCLVCKRMCINYRAA